MSTPSFNSAFSTSGSGGTSNAISYGQAQSLDGEQKLRAARNSGTLVALSYELASSEGGAMSGTLTLPRLPRSFYLESVLVTPYHYFYDPQDQMSLEVSLTRSNPSITDPVAASTEYFSGDAGTLSFNIFNPTISAGDKLTCTFNFSSSSIYGSLATGLVLWLRGVWLN